MTVTGHITLVNIQSIEGRKSDAMPCACIRDETIGHQSRRLVHTTGHCLRNYHDIIRLEFFLHVYSK